MRQILETNICKQMEQAVCANSLNELPKRDISLGSVPLKLLLERSIVSTKLFSSQLPWLFALSQSQMSSSPIHAPLPFNQLGPFRPRYRTAMDHLWIKRLFVIRPNSSGGMLAIQFMSQTNAAYCVELPLNKSSADVGENSNKKARTLFKATYAGTDVGPDVGKAVGCSVVGSSVGFAAVGFVVGGLDVGSSVGSGVGVADVGCEVVGFCDGLSVGESEG